MVAALAGAWGWGPEAGTGKVVWAELGTTGPSGAAGECRYYEGPIYSLRPVRLLAVPWRLMKGSEDHLDELFRELQIASLAWSASGALTSGVPGPLGGRPLGGMVCDGGAEVVAFELAPLAEHVKRRLSRVRGPMRRAIWEAAGTGERLVDIDLLADARSPAVLALCEALLDESAKASRLGYLLTEPAGHEIVAWRRWLRREVESQIAGAPPSACRFPAERGTRGTQVKHVQRPALAGLVRARKRAFAEVRALLEREQRGSAVLPWGAGEVGAVADALESVAAYARARHCAIFRLADDNETVVPCAPVNFPCVDREPWGRLRISSDLPVPEAIRTGRPVILRSLVELADRYPTSLSVPSSCDAALACLPLVARDGRGAIGSLALGFAHEADFDNEELDFLEELAGELADHIVQKRREAARRRSIERERAVESSCAALAGARSDRDVIAVLVAAIVDLVADGAVVHLIGESGQLCYVTGRHRDPEREAAGLELFQRQRYIGAGDSMAYECARTGEALVLQSLSEEAIVAGARDDADIALMRKLAIGSVAVVPLIGGAGVLGVVRVANSVGRFLSGADVAIVRRLADRAGATLARGGRPWRPGPVVQADETG